jgi:4-alpha-glucanotransferase
VIVIEPHRLPRSGGVLLHPTSLPGPYGIGDLGPTAFAWVDALAAAGLAWWQILPLGPTGAGDSPYQCFSAFAGNPCLISPDLLVEDGLLEPSDLEAFRLPDGPIDYGRVLELRTELLKKCWERFQSGAASALRAAFEEFQTAQKAWLDDYALFMAIKEAHPGPSTGWPAELIQRDAAVLRAARRERADAVGRHQLSQFLFFRQWRALKEHAHSLGVKLIGDLPIFVSPDSSDVWSRPGLFLLDRNRVPKVVAGVPPDYFSLDGQRWGNPLYDWEAMRADGYSWWIDRLRATLEQVDLVRIDHFRGFEAYWEIPADSLTARTGRWVKGPGADLFRALGAALGQLSVIAEDLGVITPEVEALREKCGLPGMRVLQFAFGGAVEERFLPYNYDQHTVVYTGTHDNETTVGWFAGLTAKERDFFLRYEPAADADPAWALIRLAWESVADLAVVPLQDVLSLGNEARMNHPGTVSGNWRWRADKDFLAGGQIERLGELSVTYGRSSKEEESTPAEDDPLPR